VALAAVVLLPVPKKASTRRWSVIRLQPVATPSPQHPLLASTKTYRFKR